MTLLTQKIDEALAQLSMPLTPAQVQCGWTKNAKIAAIQYLTEVRENSRSAVPYSIVRTLDSCGVFGGDLHCRIAEISNLADSTS